MSDGGGDDDDNYDDADGYGIDGDLEEGEYFQNEAFSPEIELGEDSIVPVDRYELIEYADVHLVLDKLVQRTNLCEYIGLDPDACEVLLQMSKWNVERLTDSILSDRESFLSKCGLSHYGPGVSNRLQAAISHPNSSRDSFEHSSNKAGASKVNSLQCKICFEYFEQPLMFALGCNHWFCKICYASYLEQQISEGPSCILSICPQFKCYERITSSFFRHLCSKEHFDKYRVYISKNFIECSREMKYCPNPLCNKVAIGSGINFIDCSCKTSFCFKCGESRHDPCTCSQLAQWNAKCKDESETTNWIIANTQKCPKCHSRIEKNQGCNHMVCKICKHDFCWVCSGDWSEHNQSTGGYYKCNKFVAGEAKSGSSDKEKAKLELERYIHYYSRYNSSLAAEKFAATQKTNEIAKIYKHSISNYNDHQYKIQALESVIRCRQVLKYTYIVGYHLQDSHSKKSLFEHRQEMLEKTTERLQALTDGFDQVAGADRSSIINLNRAVESFVSNVLDMDYSDIMDGMASPKSRGIGYSSGFSAGGGGAI